MADKRYNGLTIGEAKERIIADLFDNKLLKKQDRIEQNVGFHDRCKTPIEILSESQWFVKIDKDAILARSSRD